MQNEVSEILNTDINNLKIENLEFETGMANKPDIVLLRYQADNSPTFEGNIKQLNRFITSCEHFLRNSQNANDPAGSINTCLKDAILNKLRNRAADLICSRLELNSWDHIKMH